MRCRPMSLVDIKGHAFYTSDKNPNTHNKMINGIYGRLYKMKSDRSKNIHIYKILL